MLLAVVDGAVLLLVVDIRWGVSGLGGRGDNCRSCTLYRRRAAMVMFSVETFHGGLI